MRLRVHNRKSLPSLSTNDGSTLFLNLRRSAHYLGSLKQSHTYVKILLLTTRNRFI